MFWKKFNREGWIKFVIGNSITHKMIIDEQPLKLEIGDGTFLVGEIEISQIQDIPYAFRYVADKLEKYFNEEGHI